MSTTYRTCPRSGLQFELQAERLMLANAVAAVVFLLIGGILAVDPSDAGMHLVGHLDPAIPDRIVAAAAARAGMGLTALSRYAVGPAPRNGLVLGYAAHDAGVIAQGIQQLARIIEVAQHPRR